MRVHAAAEVIVVGGGIVGCASAYALSAAGLKVLMVRDQVVGDATAAGMGHLVVIDDDPALLALTQTGLAQWEALAPQLPCTAQWAASGTLWIASDQADVELGDAKMRRLSEAGVPHAWLDPLALREAEPVLREGLAGAVHMAQDAVLYPPVAAQWLLAQAQLAGAQVVEGRVARAFEGGVTLDDTSTLHADKIVLCTGLATASLLAEGLREQVPLRPRKGHLLITGRYAPRCQHQLVELGYGASAHGNASESVAFNLQPRSTGQWLLGSSRQFDAQDREIDRPLVARMIDRGLAFVPSLAQQQATRVWTGVRAATPDKLPLIGELQGAPGLYLATGHEGLGITTALSTAAMVRQHLVGDEGRDDLPTPRPRAQDFSPARFAQHSSALERAPAARQERYASA